LTLSKCLGKLKERISKEIKDLSFEELQAYFERTKLKKQM
jgi:hypothetical protein